MTVSRLANIYVTSVPLNIRRKQFNLIFKYQAHKRQRQQGNLQECTQSASLRISHGAVQLVLDLGNDTLQLSKHTSPCMPLQIYLIKFQLIFKHQAYKRLIQQGNLEESTYRQHVDEFHLCNLSLILDTIVSRFTLSVCGPGFKSPFSFVRASPFPGMSESTAALPATALPSCGA